MSTTNDTPGSYTHAGVTISLNSKGEFAAQVGGKYITKPSLKAMKEYIDRVKAYRFKEFGALIDEGYYRGSVEEAKPPIAVKVTGRERTGNIKYGAKYQWIVEDRRQRPSQILIDTEDNRDAVRALREWQRESEQIAESRRKVENELRERLVWVHADKYEEE